jgi:uncharacterized protein YcbX
MLLTTIQVFPIKSLDPVVVEQSTITTGRSLHFDRRWALHRSSDGKTVNGKKYPAVHRLRARYDLANKWVGLTAPQQREEGFVLEGDYKALNAYLSDYFGEQVSVSENVQQGFPDHTIGNVGASLISTATLKRVGTWFDLSVEEVNRRMRMNLIVEANEAFDEDALLAEDPENLKDYYLGEVLLHPYKPCVRCPVPTRDAQTGAITRGFQKAYVQQRLALQPQLLEHPLYDHAYNCGLVLQLSTAAIGKKLQVGDQLRQVT